MSTPKKLTDLTALGAAPANTDLLEIVDISDTTDNAAGSSKKVTVAELLTNAGGGIEFSTAISGLGSDTGQVADADTLLQAIAKINDRLPLSAGSSYPVTGDLHLTAELMIGGLTAPDTFLHIRGNPVTNYGHATFEGIAGDDCYISFQDSSAGLTSHVGTDYNADSSGNHDTILANLDGGSIKFRTGSDNLQSGLNTQAEITTGGAFLIYGSYTDASNYERLNFSQNGAGTCTIAAETLGAGTDNVDIDITPAGTGVIGANSHVDLATSKYIRAGSDPTNRYLDPSSLWRSNLALEIRSTASTIALRGGSTANAYFTVDDDSFMGGLWGTGDKTYTITVADQDAVANRGIFNLTVQAGSANASPGAGASIYGGDLTFNAGNGASGEAGAAHGGDINLTAGTGYGTGNDGNIIMASLPTSDPTVAGALWNDSGTLKVSAG